MLFMKAELPSGKAGLCKSPMSRFDSDLRLQFLTEALILLLKTRFQEFKKQAKLITSSIFSGTF